MCSSRWHWCVQSIYSRCPSFFPLPLSSPCLLFPSVCSVCSSTLTLSLSFPPSSLQPLPVLRHEVVLKHIFRYIFAITPEERERSLVQGLFLAIRGSDNLALVYSIRLVVLFHVLLMSDSLCLNVATTVILPRGNFKTKSKHGRSETQLAKTGYFSQFVVFSLTKTRIRENHRLLWIPRQFLQGERPKFSESTPFSWTGWRICHLWFPWVGIKAWFHIMCTWEQQTSTKLRFIKSSTLIFSRRI